MSYCGRCFAVIPDARVREPFEHEKFDAVRVQNGGNFTMRLQDSPMAHSIPREARAELFGRGITTARREGKRNVRLVAQSEELRPLAGWNRFERPRGVAVKAQRPHRREQHHAPPWLNSRAMQPPRPPAWST